jgi:PAS domain S-box-containing protein
LIQTNEYRIAELSFVLNNISHAILFESLSNEIIFINQNFCDLFSIPVAPEMLFGNDCSKAAEQSAGLFKAPQQFIDGIAKTYREKKAVLNEELEFADGTTIYRDYKPVLEHPVFIGHLWVYKNSLELKSILGEVQEQKMFYEDLLNNIPADIAIFDRSHRYIFMNQKALSKNDVRSWLLNKDDFDYCKKTNKPLDLAIERRKHFTEALKTGETVEFEEINKTPSGEKVFNLRRFYPLKNHEGNIEYVIGYGINITRVREREEAILQREQAFRDLVESMDQMVVSINESCKIQYTNLQWSKLMGIPSYVYLDKKLSTFINTNKVSFMDNVNSFINDSKYKTKRRRVGINDKDGKKHTLTYYIANLTTLQSDERRYAVFFNDITLQLRAENELKTIARQERKLNELKSNFIGLVSHELRTPLSVILSSAELIELKSMIKGTTASPETGIYTNRIIEQVDKMTQLMNDFLFLTKIESGKMPLNPQLIDLKIMIDKLQDELYSPWKDGRSLDISIKGRPRHVMADEAMIRNSLINIINNAFKYSQGRDAPRLRLRFTETIWEVLMIDSGIGISKEDQRNLFQPFVRGNNVGDIEGTGLGLMVVKFFVKKSKGTMLIKSVYNKGTAIVLRFPY